MQTWQGKLGAARRVPPPGLSDPGHLVRVPRLSRFSEIKCTSVLLAQPSDSVSLPTASSQSFPPTTRIRPEAAARETTSEATCSCRSQHSRKVTGARFHREAPTPGLRQARMLPLVHPSATRRRQGDARRLTQMQAHSAAAEPLQSWAAGARPTLSPSARLWSQEGTGLRAEGTHGPAHSVSCWPVTTVSVHVDQRLSARVALPSTGHGAMSGAF